MTINGIQSGDSIIGKAKVPTLGNLDFKGVVKENKLSGNFLKNGDMIIGTLNSENTTKNHIDYNSFYPKIIEITKNNIYSREVLLTKEWHNFQKQLERLCNTAQDDIEFFLGFNLLSQGLPFSHFNIIFQKETSDYNELEIKEVSIIFEEINSTTAYLKIKNFSSSKEELAVIFPKIIGNKNYKNLIVDLKDNPGGGLEAALEFAKHTLNNTTEIGYFVTNKLQNSGFNADVFESLPETQSKTTADLIGELKSVKGVKFTIPKSDQSIFTGNLYVLTNSKTASTSEPIIYVLKNKGATVVGEKTAGAMLSATLFEIDGKYKLILPIADFFTYDGFRLDRIGVMPDIETKSKDALEEVLKMIDNK